MAVEHSTLTDPDLHEPKGASSAAANTAYIANGSGSGAWTVLKDLNKMCLTVKHTDMANATSVWVVAPLAGNITKIYSVIDAAFDVDTTVTASIAGVSVTNGVITITASGSAAGDVDSCTPTAAYAVTAGQAIKLLSSGAGTTVGAATFTIEISLT